MVQLSPPSKVVVALAVVVAVVVVGVALPAEALPKRHYDKTIKRYTNEKTCWWNEICKEEFQQEFRCRCPRWSFCRSPGRYYNAYCSVMASGYVWTQPRFPVHHHHHHHQSPPPPSPESSPAGKLAVTEVGIGAVVVGGGKVRGVGGGVSGGGGGGGARPSPYGFVGK